MSVETGSSIGSIGSTIGSVATAEISSSLSSPSFSVESRSFSSGLVSDIPDTGEIFNSVPSISSFEDGGVISHDNPFDIQSVGRPTQFNTPFESANFTPELTDNPIAPSLRSYDILSHAENVLAETQAVETQPDEFSRIMDAAGDILREARVKESDSTSLDLSSEIFTDSEKIILTNFSETVGGIGFEPKIELVMNASEFEVAGEFRPIDQMELTADIAQAQRTIDAVMKAGFNKEFAMQAVGPMLEAKGLTLTETEVEVDGKMVQELRIAQNNREKVKVPNYIIDEEALGEREKITEKAIDEAFRDRKPGEEITGASIAGRIPEAKPNSKVMSRINRLDDPTPDEYVRRDIEAIDIVKDEDEVQNKIRDINMRHVPVSLDYHGKYVTEDDVKKVTKGKNETTPAR